MKNNYLPIPTLSLLSKIAERFINTCLSAYLAKKVASTDEFLVFQKKKNEAGLWENKLKLIGNIQNQLIAVGSFLCVRKQYHSVNYEILLNIVECY